MKLSAPCFRWLAILICPWFLTATGCDGDSPGCTEGQSSPCACADGRFGAQVCSSDGTFGPCECSGGDGDADGDTDSDGDADSDGDSDTDAYGDTDGDEPDCDVDNEADLELDADPDPDVPHCDGYLDTDTDLCWQSPPAADPYGSGWQPMNYHDALAYCESMGDGWELPSISTLRTLIMGCPMTEPEGECLASDECRSSTCSEACSGCDEGAGPGPDGTYLWCEPDGPHDDAYVSATTVQPDESLMWVISPLYGSVFTRVPSVGGYVRCVRPME